MNLDLCRLSASNLTHDRRKGESKRKKNLTICLALGFKDFVSTIKAPVDAVATL